MRLAAGIVAALATAVGLAAAGCTGNSTTAPTQTTTDNTPSITLTGYNPSRVATMLQIGQTQQYQLSLTTINGVGQPQPADLVVTWTSSNPAVLSIDSNGNATGLASGFSTIKATATTGQTASLTVQVVPVYQGAWIGHVSVVGCTDLAGFAANGYCARVQGQLQPFRLVLQQVNSSTGNVVSGTLTKAEGGSTLTGSLSGGNIGTGGDLGGLTGTIVGSADGVSMTATVTSWNSLATGSRMTGAWSVAITSPQVIGAASVRYVIADLTLAQ